jgi:hypothetical protein
MKVLSLIILLTALGSCSSTMTMRPYEADADLDDLLVWDLRVQTKTSMLNVKGGLGRLGDAQGKRFLRGGMDSQSDRIIPLDSIVVIWPQVKSIVSFTDGRAQVFNVGNAGFSVHDGRVEGVVLSGRSRQPADSVTSVTLIDPKNEEKVRLRQRVNYYLGGAVLVGLLTVFAIVFWQ